MNRIFYNSQSQPIQLSHKLGTGGEGSVYEIAGQTDFVAKIYHEPPEPEKAEKLIALSRLGNERLLKLAAWPVDVLRVEAEGQLAGFVMKKIGQASEVHTLHSPKSRLQKFPEASWAFLIYVAANIARAVATVHEHDFIVGDLNPKNILVTHQATVALLDCDSFQVTADGKLFRCEGGFPEYLPPELQGKSLRDVERKQSHDCFGLAVVIFQLLFMGRHPFSGKFTGAGEITLEDAIRKSRFAFGADAAARQMQAPPGTLSLEAIPVSLVALFRRAFLSADRPQPQEWIEPLETLAKTLKPCDMHTGHFFFSELDECPWCEIEMRARIRLFNFSLDGHNGRRSRFKLDEVWGKIEALKTLPSPLALDVIKNDLAMTTQPSVEVAAFAKNMVNRLLWGVLFAAVAGCSIGYFLPWLVRILTESILGYLGLWLSLGLTLTGIAGAAAKKIAGAESNTGKTLITNLSLKSPQSAANNPLAAEVRTRLQSADQTVQQLSEQLEKMSGAASFQPKLEELRNRREVYERLPKIREFKLKHLETTARDRQLNEFLDQFEIGEAAVKEIDITTAASLRSSGIETAADLIPDRLKRVSDLTETQAQQLLFWRAGLKRQFKPDPAGGVQVQERITVEREIDNLRMQLEHEMTRGAVYLQRMVQEAGNQQQQISAALPEAYRLQAQAEKDWEVVQKQNPFWPLAIMLIVFFILGTFLSILIPVRYELRHGTYSSPETTTTSSSSTVEPEPAAAEPESSVDQNGARVLFEKGERLAEKGSWAEAAKLFQRATELDPQFYLAYTQLGRALYWQGKYDESIEASTRATRIREEFESNFYLGLAYKAKKQWKFAADSFVQAIDLNNDSTNSNLADSYYYLGESLMHTGQLKITIADLESIVDAGTATVAQRFQLATFYLWVGKYDLSRRQHDVLKNSDENLAAQLQRLMKQHSKQRGRG